MLKLFSKKWTENKGFTLIELLVVIAIIGVLASIIIASLNNSRKKARDTRRLTDIKQIQLALELYFDANSSAYPVSTAICTGTPLTTAVENRGLQDLVIKGFIPQIARDPNSTTAAPICYLYASKPTPITTYHLGAKMEDDKFPALSGDKDCNSTTALPTALSCGGSIYTNGFVGTDTTADPIYDVIP